HGVRGTSMRSIVSVRLWVAAACAVIGACAGVKQQPGGSGGAVGGDASVGTGHQDGGSPIDIARADITIAPPHSTCGDGVRSQDEACYDGNAAVDDGCAADCLTVD